MAPTNRLTRPRRILAWVLGLLLGVPIVLVALVLLVVLVGANTGAGRRLIEQQAASLTGGLVKIDGLGGRFPDALTIRRLTLDDYLGPYATLDGVRLDWQPLRLLRLTARVNLASVEAITVLRRPASDPNAKPSPPRKPGQTSSVPNLRIDIHRLMVGSLSLEPAVAGIPARVRLDGHVRIDGIKPLLDGVSIANLPDTDIGIGLARLDQMGFLSLVAAVTPGRIGLHLHGADPEGGLVTAVGHLPALDPLTLALDFDGPRDAEPLKLALVAGPVTLDAWGIANLLTQHFDIQARGHAPAMEPRPGIAWNELSLAAHLVGTPSAPAGEGNLLLDSLSAAGAGVGRLTAHFSGAESGGSAIGPATLHAVAEGLRIPGPQPALFAATPLTLDATLHNEQPGHPVDLTLFHTLAQVTGRIFTTPGLHGTVGITLPELGPLAAAGGTALDGHAAISTNFSYASGIAVLGLGGTFAVTGGQAQAAHLIGDQGVLGLTASLAGRDLRLYSLNLHGRALDLDASGSDLSNVLAARFGLRLPDLQAALPSLRGTLSIDGTAQGPQDDLSAQIGASGDIGTSSIPAGPLHLAVDAAHLPHNPQGHLNLDGTLDRAPLTLAARVQHMADGATHVTLDRLGWKSALGHADMTLPAGAKLPIGSFDLRMTRLADLTRVIGQAISGNLAAAIRTTQGEHDAHPTLRVNVGGAVANAALRVGKLALNGTVLDPAGSPDVDLALRADGILAKGITGGLRATARGPQQALAVVAKGAFDHVAGAQATVDTALVLDLPDKHVSLNRLSATAKGEALHLLQPARIGFGTPMQVDHLRASLAPAAGGTAALIDIAGTISPKLNLNASLTNITPALAKPFDPALDASGVIAAQAHLTGTTARPSGTVRLTAQSMRLRSGPGASLPPANLDAKVDLANGEARVDAHLEAGPQIGLTLAGTAPVGGDGPLDLRARGGIDLAVANAVLGAQGRQAGGQLSLDMGVSGTAKAPRLAGTVRLANGQIQDFGQGIRLTDISALIQAQGQSVNIAQFTAHAGDGVINASGTVGALAPGLPVDLHITAKNARPLASDLLTAVLDADITARGQASSRLDVAGSVTIDSAAINIPSGLPPSVTQLDVIRPGQKPPPPASAAGSSTVGLDMTLLAPGQIFVRGHGLDAELGGKLHAGGTTTAPVISGGFDMRNGTFSLAGVSLTFTKGRVGFNGAGVTNKIDPSLDFTAESFVGADVARLNVGGYADAPKITLSSTPTLPQDQVLALILFQQTTTQLSALQIASVAAGLAELSGVGGGGPGVLGTVRGTLGLDRLSLGSGGANSKGTSVEAGKYVMRGVYVGAKQSTSGAGTQAQVQIDLTKRLKLDTVVGTGGAVTGTTTPENDPGSSVGLKYQFQY